MIKPNKFSINFGLFFSAFMAFSMLVILNETNNPFLDNHDKLADNDWPVVFQSKVAKFETVQQI